LRRVIWRDLNPEVDITSLILRIPTLPQSALLRGTLARSDGSEQCERANFVKSEQTLFAITDQIGTPIAGGRWTCA
jgi:hypothetical protein